MSKIRDWYHITALILILLGFVFIGIGIIKWESKYTIIGACLCWSWLPIKVVESLVKEIKK